MTVEILAPVRNRQRSAFERLWSRERERVWRLVARLSGDADVADDLTQEVALRALAAFSGFRGVARPSTWLYRIAVNVVLRWRERRHEETGIDAGVWERLAASDTPERAALASEDAARVRQAMERLSEELRTPLVLLVWEGMTYREIASVLRIPIGTVMSRLHAARQRLRKELGDAL